MREFKDEEGRPWRVALTVSAVLRVRDLVSVEVDDGNGGTRQIPFDLADAAQISTTFQVLRSQYAKIGEVLAALLVRQIEERKLTRDEFLDALRGDSLEAATTALEQELVDFFPQRLRKMVALLAAKMTEVSDQMLTKAEANLHEATIETLAERSGTPSGRQLGFSEFTPDGGRSDSSSPLETAA